MSAAAASGAERIAELVAALEPIEDVRLAPAKELVRAVLEVHGRGLAALMNVLKAQCGETVLEICARDREIAALLLLHDLHPHPLERRVEQALANVRRNDAAPDVTASLSEIRDGAVVRLKLEGKSSRGISVAKLRREIEAAVLELAPEIAAVEFEGMPSEGEVAFVSIAGLKASAGQDELRGAH